MNHDMPVTTPTEQTVPLSTGNYIPYRFLLKREIGSVSTHYTLTSAREGDVRQHRCFRFSGVGMSVSSRIIGVLGTKGSQ